MSKKMLFVLAGALLVGACAPQNIKASFTDLKHPEKGAFSAVVPVAVKDFKTMGIIYVTSKVTYDINGDKNGSEITYEQLMREAEKLGGDDVINVRIDQRDIYNTKDYYNVSSVTSSEQFTHRQHFPKETIYTATALAIKYLNGAESSFVPPMGAPVAATGGALVSTYTTPVAATPAATPAAPASKATPVKSASKQGAVRRSMFFK